MPIVIEARVHSFRRVLFRILDKQHVAVVTLQHQEVGLAGQVMGYDLPVMSDEVNCRMGFLPSTLQTITRDGSQEDQVVGRSFQEPCMEDQRKSSLYTWSALQHAFDRTPPHGSLA